MGMRHGPRSPSHAQRVISTASCRPALATERQAQYTASRARLVHAMRPIVHKHDRIASREPKTRYDARSHRSRPSRFEPAWQDPVRSNRKAGGENPSQSRCPSATGTPLPTTSSLLPPQHPCSPRSPPKLPHEDGASNFPADGAVPSPATTGAGPRGDQ